MKFNKVIMNLLICLKVIVILYVCVICWIVGELVFVGSFLFSGNLNVRIKGSNFWYGKNMWCVRDMLLKIWGMLKI